MATIIKLSTSPLGSFELIDSNGNVFYQGSTSGIYASYSRVTTGDVSLYSSQYGASILVDIPYTNFQDSVSGVFANLLAFQTYMTTNFFFKAGGGSGGTASFATITGQPTDNAPLSTALNNKVDKANAPVPYLGQVATHCLVPTNKYAAATGQWTMARSLHWARAKITNPTIVFPNYLVSQTSVETSNSAGTIKASIEYPAGTFTLSNENIAAGALVTMAAGLQPLTFTIAMPEGAQFWIRTYQVNNNGPVYQQYQNNYDQPLSEGFESGTSASGDKTTSGTIAFGGGFAYTPILILAQTTRPSAIIIGDSKQCGGRDAVTDQYGDIGEIPRVLSQYMGYTNFSIAGSLLAPYLAATRTIRDQIVNGTITGLSSGTPYFTHVIDAYGINDLGGGGTATALATNRASFAALYPTLTCVGTTFAPYTNSTDLWATQANQSPGTNEPKVLVFNAMVRAGIVGEKYILDVGLVLDPYGTGLWPVAPNFNIGAPINQWVGTGSITGTTMTITAITSGTIKIYDYITGANLQPGVQITALGTGTGGTGTYTVNYSQTAASGTIQTGGYGTYDGLHETAATYNVVANALKPLVPLIFKH